MMPETMMVDEAFVIEHWTGTAGLGGCVHFHLVQDSQQECHYYYLSEPEEK